MKPFITCFLNGFMKASPNQRVSCHRCDRVSLEERPVSLSFLDIMKTTCCEMDANLCKLIMLNGGAVFVIM